jgi:hypothetical protein
MGLLSTIFGSGNLVSSVEGIAKEWIETGKEKAEASALMIKTLDPNGLMRRQISQTVCGLYKLYILTALVLVFMMSFKIGDSEGVKMALDKITELFVPITASFTAIIGASFGVNGVNASKGI